MELMLRIMQRETYVPNLKKFILIYMAMMAKK